MLRPRHFDPDRPSGSEITVGNIGKLASAIAEFRADIADLGKRIDAVIASTKATIAAADERDRLARGPRR